MAVSPQLHQLFVSIFRDCTSASPKELWDTFWPDICDDSKYKLSLDGIEDASDAQVQDYSLYLIDKLLSLWQVPEGLGQHASICEELGAGPWKSLDSGAEGV